MLLAVDVGNTNIAFGVYDEHSGWGDHWRIRTVHDKMADEYAVLFRSLLLDSRLDMQDIDRVVLSCVVPPLTGTLSWMFRERVGKDPLVVGPGVRTGLRIRTDTPSEVGADLVANAVAAYERVRGACVIVDFGTALTFTAVSGLGDLMGVAIAPGLNSAAAALSRNTAQLPHVQLVPPPTAIGRNTTHSIQSGVVFGYIGLVESLVDRIRAELDGDVSVIATGGLARVIAPLTNRFSEIDPWLTLDGLRIIADRSR